MTHYRDCFAQAVDAAIAGATVLTANTRSARAVQSAAEERLRQRSEAWPSPDVLPIGALVERLYSDALIANALTPGAVTRLALGREQELHLWRQVIEHSPMGRRMLVPESAAALAAASFRTALEYGIPLDGPQMSVSSESRAFAGWAADFRGSLAAHGWSCAALLAGELAPCLPALRLPRQLYAFLDGATPAQRELLQALEKAGVDVRWAPDYAPDSTPDAGAADAGPAERCSATRYPCASESEELQAAACWARQQVESAPEARIGVILLDLDGRRAEVESVFRSVLHPEHLLGGRGPEARGEIAPQAFEIASAKPLADYPVVRCALQLLAFVAAPVDFHTFAAMLRSPYLFGASRGASPGASPEIAPEALARFVSRIRAQARRQVSFDDLHRWLADPKLADPKLGNGELRALRAAVERLPRRATFSSVQSAAYWTELARTILRAFGWPGAAALDSEEYQCTESWGELFSALSSLELLDWRTDFAGFAARLERAAAARNFKPETRNAPVQIMDLAESEGSCFDALWIGGVSDEQWPRHPAHSPLIPLALLKAAGAPVAGTPEADARIARITARLLQSAPRVCLSVALSAGEDREQRWSPLFSGPKFAGPKFAGVAFSAAPRIEPTLAARFLPAALESISDETAPALAAGEQLHGGAALLGEQSDCPFRAFAVRRLNARQDAGPNEALAPFERGRIVERALEWLWDRLENSGELRRAELPRLNRLMAEAVDAAMGSVLDAPDGDRWTLRFRALERRRTIEVLTEWLRIEASRPPFRVLGHQLKVELELAGLVLRGRLDRLDAVGGEQVVIDYKTGARNSPGAWQLPRPRLPQLPFYALARLVEDQAQEDLAQKEVQKGNVAGISFAVIRRGECGFKSCLRDKSLLAGASQASRSLAKTKFDDYMPLWREELERIVRSFAAGDAAVDPRVPPGRSDSPCGHCHLGALCRVGDEHWGDEHWSDEPDADGEAESEAAEFRGAEDE